MDVTTPINSIRPMVQKADTSVKPAQVSIPVAKNISFSGGVKAPKNVLKAAGKALRSVVKWSIAAVILAYRAGKGLFKLAGNALKALAGIFKK